VVVVVVVVVLVMVVDPSLRNASFGGFSGYKPEP